MITQLQTGFLLFVSLGLFLSFVAVIVIVLFVVSAIPRPGQWHERPKEIGLVHSTNV